MEIPVRPGLGVGSVSPHNFTPRASHCVNYAHSESTPPNRIFILGMGYVGQFFAHHLITHNQPWAVTGTCTSHSRKKILDEIGFQVYHFDANEPEPSVLDLLKHHTHLLVSIPPLSGIGDPMLQHEELLRNALINGNLQWICYLSSTSVYGDCGGDWVDEDSWTNPTSELGKLRLSAEQGWSNMARALGCSAQIFRLGGIYGPGRSAVDTILKQESLSKSQKNRAYQKYTSRVHVEDICQAIEASIYAPSLWRVYNIVDDDPASREEVFRYARKLVEEKWPGVSKQSPPCTESQRVETKNLRGEKRVSNARMKKQLGVQLLHPNYESGLRSIINQMESPFQHPHPFIRLN